MLKRSIHIILSCWLALLLVFGGTSQEFIHLFTGHEDTVHCVHHSGELTFENEHHHCDFLSFSLPPFIAQDFFLPATMAVEIFPTLEAALTSSLFEPVVLANSLRGPPPAC